MYSLYKKEIAAFFCSATGYLVVSVFLVATGLLLWVVPGELNIIYGGYATLDALFAVAPWIYLFLVPAVSMRLLAEERKSGTLELLLIRPLPIAKIVMAKYLAGFTLVLLSIAPTLTYVGIVWFLGSPEGNLDMGGTMGSYIGLVFLAAIYMSIGLFASSLTDNQIVAFVVGAALSLFFYAGFDAISALPVFGGCQSTVEAWGIAAHYASISRGVVDSRDVIYFVSVAAYFVALTCLVINRRK